MEKRDIKADYIASYREQLDTAIAAGKLGHARRIAHALEGLGVKVTVPTAAAKETTAASTPAETAAEQKPAEDAKPTPAAETAAEAKPGDDDAPTATTEAEAKPAAKRAASSRGKAAGKE